LLDSFFFCEVFVFNTLFSSATLPKHPKGFFPWEKKVQNSLNCQEHTRRI